MYLNKMTRLVQLLVAVVLGIGALTAQPLVIDRPGHRLILDHPGDSLVVDSTLEAARGRLQYWLADSLTYRPEVYVVADSRRFDTLVGGLFPDWGAAAAIPAWGRIVVKDSRYLRVGKELTELLVHEYAHLATADRVGARELPRWLDEGIAMRMAAPWGWSEHVAMGKAALFRQFVPLREIEQVNRFTDDRAAVAYAQSYLAVDYLTQQYDPEGLQTLLGGLAEGLSVDSALVLATGSDLAGFETELFDYLAARYNIATLFMDTWFLWVGLAGVVVLGAILARRRRVKTLERWKRDEQYESKDFDYGDPKAAEKIDLDDTEEYDEYDPDADDDEDEPWRR